MSLARGSHSNEASGRYYHVMDSTQLPRIFTREIHPALAPATP